MTPNEYSPVSHDVAYPALKAIREMAGVRPYPGAPPLAGADADPWSEAAKQAGYVTKDSGVRQEFSTGSVRDTTDGKGSFVSISPHMLHRLAQLMERGAKKYGLFNWQKGQPMSRVADSAMRHMNQARMGDASEDHKAAVIFNMMAWIHFEEEIAAGRLPLELDDLPRYPAPDPRQGWDAAAEMFNQEDK